jgi:hypothetical protein
VRARVRTVGVEEHHFVVERGEPDTHDTVLSMAPQGSLRGGPDAQSDVYITDVGGSRSQVGKSYSFVMTKIDADYEQ